MQKGIKVESNSANTFRFLWGNYKLDELHKYEIYIHDFKWEFCNIFEAMKLLNEKYSTRQ